MHFLLHTELNKAVSLFLAAVLEVSNRDTTKGVCITTHSKGRLFNVSHLKTKTNV